MTLPEFLVKTPDGEILFAGHRISLYDVMYYHKAGCTAEMLHDQFPTLAPELIQKALVFARQNTAEVDAYVTNCGEKIEHLRATTPRVPDWAELRRRMDAMKVAGGQGVMFSS
jgi:uncharacterized protein (DUF433 family)